MSEPKATAPRQVTVLAADVQFPLKRAVDDVLDDLIVGAARKVALLEENRDQRSNRLALSRSQVRNLVNVALGTRSREAVTNFVRYQMGRADGAPWKHRARGKRAFGRELIADLERDSESASLIDASVEKVCGSVFESLSTRGCSVDGEELRREARSRLISLYLGYLNRTYAYCEATDDEGKNKSCWEDVRRVVTAAASSESGGSSGKGGENG